MKYIAVLAALVAVVQQLPLKSKIVHKFLNNELSESVSLPIISILINNYLSDAPQAEGLSEDPHAAGLSEEPQAEGLSEDPHAAGLSAEPQAVP